jgi:hypothetical protein
MNTHLKAVRMTVTAGAAALLTFGLAGCNGLMHPEDFPQNGPTTTATSNPQEVHADDFGHAWSLDVDHGTITCSRNGKGEPVLRFATPEGVVYALNTVDDNADLPPIGDISDGSTGTLLTFAFTVCDA